MDMNLIELIQKYWYVLVVAAGLLVLLGAIFKWKWVLGGDEGCDPRFAPLRLARKLFGFTGYRIAMGILGVLVMALTIWYAVMMKMWNT